MEIPRGEGYIHSRKFFKVSMMLNWNFQRGEKGGNLNFSFSCACCQK